MPSRRNSTGKRMSQGSIRRQLSVELPVRPDSRASSGSGETPSGRASTGLGRTNSSVQREISVFTRTPEGRRSSAGIGKKGKKNKGRCWERPIGLLEQPGHVADEERAVKGLRAISGEVWMKCEQLRQVMRLFRADPGSPSRVDVVILFRARLVDVENINKICYQELHPKQQLMLGRRLGWLAVYNMRQPDLHYHLRMDHPEERECARRLCSISSGGGAGEDRTWFNLYISSAPKRVPENANMWGMISGGDIGRTQNVIHFDFVSSHQQRKVAAAIMVQTAWRRKLEQRELNKLMVVAIRIKMCWLGRIVRKRATSMEDREREEIMKRLERLQQQFNGGMGFAKDTKEKDRFKVEFTHADDGYETPTEDRSGSPPGTPMAPKEAAAARAAVYAGRDWKVALNEILSTTKKKPSAIKVIKRTTTLLARPTDVGEGHRS